MAASLPPKELRALERSSRGFRTKKRRLKTDASSAALSLSPEDICRLEGFIGRKRKAPERASDVASIVPPLTEETTPAAEVVEVLPIPQRADPLLVEELAPSVEIGVVPVAESPTGQVEQEGASLPFMVASSAQDDPGTAHKLPGESSPHRAEGVEAVADAQRPSSGPKSSEKGIQSGSAAARASTPDEAFYAQEALDSVDALRGEVSSLRTSLEQERAARSDAEFFWKREMRQHDLLAQDLSVKDEVIQNLHHRSDWLETRLERAEIKSFELEKELSEARRRIRYLEERRRHGGDYSRRESYLHGRRERYEGGSGNHHEAHLETQLRPGMVSELERLKGILEECRARLDAWEASAKLDGASGEKAGEGFD